MAKANTTSDLTNLEKIVLLGLDDKGWFGSSENTIKFGLAGMIIFELLQSGSAVLEGKRIKVAGEGHVDDQLEEKVLEVIKKEKKTRSINNWIQRLAYRKLGLRKCILKNLMDKDMVRKEEYSLMMIFYQNKYPLENEALKKKVKDELFAEILSGEKVKAMTLMMIAVLDSCKILKKNLKDVENSSEIIKRVHELLKFHDPLTKKTKLVKDIYIGVRRGIVASRVSIHA